MLTMNLATTIANYMTNFHTINEKTHAYSHNVFGQLYTLIQFCSIDFLYKSKFCRYDTVIIVTINLGVYIMHAYLQYINRAFEVHFKI